MPSSSKSQQRLMSQAYGVRLFIDSDGKEGLNPREIDSEYREKIESLAKSMSVEDLKDFATKVEENSAGITPGSVNGMGAAQFPVGNLPGSGDFPIQLTKDLVKKSKTFKQYKEYLLTIKNMKNLQTFEEFLNESKTSKNTKILKM